MDTNRRTALGLLAGLSICVGTSAALAADSSVVVSLWDKGPNSAMIDESHPMMLGTAMMNGGMAGAMMGMTIDKASVPAGMVTFAVTNDSKDIIHEMVVSPITSLDDVLPYLKDENKIDEDAAGHLGEVAELEPGQAGSLGMEMKPGLYLLYCNIPGHYVGGMWTVLTVTQ